MRGLAKLNDQALLRCKTLTFKAASHEFHISHPVWKAARALLGVSTKRKRRNLPFPTQFERWQVNRAVHLKRLAAKGKQPLRKAYGPRQTALDEMIAVRPLTIHAMGTLKASEAGRERLLRLSQETLTAVPSR